MPTSRLSIGSLTLAGLSVAACSDRTAGGQADSSSAPTPASSSTSAPAPAPAPPTPWTPSAIAHCGAGTPVSRGGGCPGAVDAALALLEKGGDPLDAAVAGVVVLEDDVRYNAGTGANVRLDGRTVQMDASVMDSNGRFGAVAVIEGVRNPVLVARAVADTPHRLIAGEGATAMARALGHAPYDPATPEALEQSQAMRAKLVAGDPSLPAAWRDFDWRRVWNFAAPPPEATDEKSGAPPSPEEASAPPAEVEGSAAKPAEVNGTSDTVGVAVRSADGRFAAALSTGGWTLMLRGRVGDTPLPGAGLYVGKAGAVAGTGRGEKIIDVALARTVYGWLEQGIPAAEAAKRGVELLGGEGGLIVITPTESAAAAGREMAWCARDRQGPLRGP